MADISYNPKLNQVDWQTYGQVFQDNYLVKNLSSSFQKPGLLPMKGYKPKLLQFQFKPLIHYSFERQMILLKSNSQSLIQEAPLQELFPLSL